MKFLCVKNIKYLLGILHEFFMDKYNIDLTTLADKIDLRVIVFNEMQKIDKASPNELPKVKNKNAFKVSCDMIMIAISQYRQKQQFEDDARQNMMPTFQTFLPPPEPQRNANVSEEYDKLNTERMTEMTPLAQPKFEDEGYDVQPSPEEFNERVEKIMRERETMMTSVSVPTNPSPDSISHGTPQQSLSNFTFLQEEVGYSPLQDSGHCQDKSHFQDNNPQQGQKSSLLSSLPTTKRTCIHFGYDRNWFMGLDTIMAFKLAMPIQNSQRLEIDICVPYTQLTETYTDFFLSVEELDDVVYMSDGTGLTAHMSTKDTLTLANGRKFNKFTCTINNPIEFLATITCRVCTPLKSFIKLNYDPVEIKTVIAHKNDIMEIVLDDETVQDFIQGDVVLLKMCCDDESLFDIVTSLTTPTGHVLLEKKKTKKKDKSFFIKVYHTHDEVLEGVSGYALNVNLQSSITLRAS